MRSRGSPCLGLAVALVSAACASVSSPPPATSLALDRPRASAELTPELRQRIAAVQGLVARTAAKHRLDPALVNAVIWVESRFDPRAKSPAGARGLMQLMPGTAASLAEDLGHARAKSYDPAFNIAAGCLYLAKMRDRYDGSIPLALAAYHAGPGNADDWRHRAMPDYSRSYVEKVLQARQMFVALRDASRPTGTQLAARPATRPIAPAPLRDDDRRRPPEPTRPRPEPVAERNEPPLPGSTPRGRAQPSSSRGPTVKDFRKDPPTVLD